MPRKTERRAPIEKQKIEAREDLTYGYKSKSVKFDGLCKKYNEKKALLTKEESKPKEKRDTAKIERLREITKNLEFSFSQHNYKLVELTKGVYMYKPVKAH